MHNAPFNNRITAKPIRYQVFGTRILTEQYHEKRLPADRKNVCQLTFKCKARGNELVDFGAGSGRVLFSALAEGASGSYGYELPENKGMKYVFDAMLIASATVAQDRVEWIGKL